MNTIIVSKHLYHTICLFIIMLSLSSFVHDNTDSRETNLALIWTCATLVLQVSTSNFFTIDYNNGTLEQIFIQPLSFQFTIVYKVLTHWLSICLPMSLISSIFNTICLNGTIEYSIAIGISLLFNTLIITSISATGNSLMIGKSNFMSGVSQILILPIIMPIYVYFKLLANIGFLPISINTLLTAILVYAFLVLSSMITTYVALKFAVMQD